MANSAFTHDPQITVPGSSTDNAIVIFDGTAGTGFGNSTIIVDSGGNGRIGIAADTNVITITSGVVTIAGTVAATTLTGAGAGITALAAANITASGTLPALNGAALTALTAANITASGTLPALVGTALTALNASNLSTGTLPAARIAADSIVEAKLDVSNGPTNGQFLQAQSGEGGGLTWAAAGGGPSQAVQADLEAETDEDTYAPPDLIKHSPGVAKAWCRWEQTGAHGITTSYNYTSVTDGGAAGDTDHIVDTDFSGSTNITWAGFADGSFFQSHNAQEGVSGFSTIAYSHAGTPTDNDRNGIICFGDQ